MPRNDAPQRDCLSLQLELTVANGRVLRSAARKTKLRAAAYTQGGVDWVALFRRFDKDRSGSLELDELRLAVRRNVMSCVM